MDTESIDRAIENVKPVRRRLPDERQSITHRFDIAGHEGYITVGLYEDGQPGELFLTMAKEGSTISGFADAFAQVFSYALQYGVPLEDLVDKFTHVRFEPSGMTKNPDIRFAKSIVDYIARWLESKFVTPRRILTAELERQQFLQGIESPDPLGGEATAETAVCDGPACEQCGRLTRRSGRGYKCDNCSNYMSDAEVNEPD